MKTNNKQTITRRNAVKGSIVGLLSLSIPGVIRAENPVSNAPGTTEKRYPAIEDEIVSDVVGASHFNLEKLKKLVDPRPELSRATWDWRFGDWETAIGAASHVGRKDIADYLISKGARPDIFTFAMLGSYQAVKTMIEFSPGIQRILGPHGISLLRHVKAGIRNHGTNKTEAEKLVEYLESLGDADGETYLEIKEEDKKKYLGDYRYGQGEGEGFTISLNMSNLISLGGLGGFGGALYKISENRFTYNGCPSVEVTFQEKNGKVESLTLYEPEQKLIAKKI